MNPVILEVAEGFLQGGGYATPLHFLGEMLLAERKWLGNFVHISPLCCNGALFMEFMLFDAALC
jgi:hypothetical protein